VSVTSDPLSSGEITFAESVTSVRAFFEGGRLVSFFSEELGDLRAFFAFASVSLTSLSLSDEDEDDDDDDELVSTALTACFLLLSDDDEDEEEEEEESLSEEPFFIVFCFVFLLDDDEEEELLLELVDRRFFIPGVGRMMGGETFLLLSSPSLSLSLLEDEDEDDEELFALVSAFDFGTTAALSLSSLLLDESLDEDASFFAVDWTF
jgi:hypothetical protein